MSILTLFCSQELGLQSTKVVGAFHLLGNLSQLKHHMKSSLSQLRETGDVKSFVSEVSQGVTDSYLKVNGYADCIGSMFDFHVEE